MAIAATTRTLPERRDDTFKAPKDAINGGPRLESVMDFVAGS
jgi:hypothetical protein